MDFSLTVLGSNAGMPARGRHPTAQVLSIGGCQFLIDCGEGTQLQMSNYRVHKNKIDHIFISHLHGDHIFGLAGLITSYSQLSRRNPLTVHGPIGIQEMIETQLRLSDSHLLFDLIFQEYDIQDKQLILELDHVSVFSFPLDHRIATQGYLFQEVINERPLNIDAAKANNIEIRQYKAIKKGEDGITPDGKILANESLTHGPIPERSYAYCSDTIYTIDLIPHILKVDVLYHEATFKHDLLDKAIATKHSTARQAAQIAKAADVGHLLIGHYSSRYDHPADLETEARDIFAPTDAVIEGKKYVLNKDGEIIIKSIK